MSWQPAASMERLRQRAALLATVRRFFAARGVLEVETPSLVSSPVSDPHIESFALPRSQGPPLHLHTSPEYAMKRLLAAGSGDIFQIARVFRRGERSRLHNPEFTLLEWYRLGCTLEELMAECGELVNDLLPARRAVERVSYREAFVRTLQLDPLAADLARLQAAALQAGLARTALEGCSRDALLDLLVATRVGPALGAGGLTCLHRYPASQAALAALDPADARVALRFELYADGIELANGFVELADEGEQRARFEADLAVRRERGEDVAALDERFLAALRAGLPACAGVAVGFDRVVMIATGAASIDEVLAFPIERA